MSIAIGGHNIARVFLHQISDMILNIFFYRITLCIRVVNDYADTQVFANILRNQKFAKSYSLVHIWPGKVFDQ